jgi:hypothetical protein
MKTNKSTAQQGSWHERYQRHLEAQAEKEAEEEGRWHQRWHLEEEAESGAPDLPAAPSRSSGLPKSHHQQRRRPSLAKAIKTARKAGVDLTMMPDGALTLKCSQPGNGADSSNPWDEVL